MSAAEASLPRNQNKARLVASEAYPLRCCVICGLQIPTCLAVAHLDQNPGNNDADNLAWLCGTHHWMFDCGFYPMDGLKLLRQHWQRPNGHLPSHRPRMKDAGAKAAQTRKSRAAERKGAEAKSAVAKKRSAAALKAWETRRAKRGIPTLGEEQSPKDSR